MADIVLYIPIFTTALSAVFAFVIARRYLAAGRPPHLAWWAAGVVLFGVGTFTEGFTSVVGWREPVFRAWYISGALLGGFPLAQGTVYLLLPRKLANRLSIALVTLIVFAAVLVILAPIDASRAETHRLAGRVIEWSWVRAFSPFINLYAFVFLVGGAVYSAVKMRADAPQRAMANVVIAVGALLPGIGGGFTRFGHVEVLYVTECTGLLLIFAGYHLSTRGRAPSRRLESLSATAVGATGG